MVSNSLKIRPIFIIIPLLIIDLICISVFASSIQERKVLIKNDKVVCSDFIIKQVRTILIPYGKTGGLMHYSNEIIASETKSSNVVKLKSQSLVYEEFENDFDTGEFSEPVNICFFVVNNEDFSWIQNISYKNNVIFTETSLFFTGGDIVGIAFFMIFLIGAHFVLFRKPKTEHKEPN